MSKKVSPTTKGLRRGTQIALTGAVPSAVSSSATQRLDRAWRTVGKTLDASTRPGRHSSRSQA